MNIFFTFEGGSIRLLEHLKPDKLVQLNPIHTLSTLMKTGDFQNNPTT